MANVLFATIADPECLTSGNAIRDHFLVRLIAREHNVVIACPDQSPELGRSPLPATKVAYKLRSPLASLVTGVAPNHLYHADHRCTPTRSKIDELARYGPFDVFWSSMLYPAISIIGQTFAGSARLIWDTHNNDYEVFRAMIQVGGTRGAYARTQSRTVLQMMRHVSQMAACVVACTEADARSLSRLLDRTDIELALNGVDTLRWGSVAPPTTTLPPRFVIFGSLFSSGNTSRGALFFLANEWPAIRQKYPEAELTIAGSNPGAKLRRAVAASAGVTLVANPDDMPAVVAKHTHILVPQYAGHGSKIKMVESLASGLPVVATAEACVGLPLDVRRHVQVVAPRGWNDAIAIRSATQPQDRAQTIASLDWRAVLEPAAALLDRV